MNIDTELKRLIPPLQDGEYRQLEDSIAAHGCRDALVTWRGVLLDGHNRHEICTRRGVPFKTIELDLPSREHALLWIEENQLARRNLSDDQRAVIALSVLRRRTALSISERNARNRRGSSDVADTPSATFRDRSKDTYPTVARAAKVAERKLRTVQEIAKKQPEALEAIRTGARSVAEVKTAIRRDERVERIAALAAPGPLPDRRFPVLLADPPWRYEYTETESRAIENQYPTMTLDQICALGIDELALPDAILFLWVTNPKLAEAFAVLRAWNFEYRTCMVWVKDQIGMGYYVRQQHELLLIAKRGDLPVPEPANRPSSVIQAPRMAHSAKPPIVHDLIDAMYPELPKVELFARGLKRDGWTGWGIESRTQHRCARREDAELKGVDHG